MGKFFKIAKRNPVNTFITMWEIANKNYAKAANIGDLKNASKYSEQINRLAITDIGKALKQVDTKSFNILQKLRTQQLKN